MYDKIVDNNRIASDRVRGVVVLVQLRVVLEHPPRVVQERRLLLHLVHEFGHALALGGHWRVLLVQLVL